MEKEKKENAIVATFTTLLQITSDITNTSAMGAFFVEYTKKTTKDY